MVKSDKDKQPRWKKKDQAKLEEYFATLSDNGTKPISIDTAPMDYCCETLFPGRDCFPFCHLYRNKCKAYNAQIATLLQKNKGKYV